MGRMRDTRRLASAWALSLLVHGGLVGSGAALVASSLTPVERPVLARSTPLGDEHVDIELPEMVAGADVFAQGPGADDATPVPRGGGEATPRPDTGRAGRGGTDEASAPALNLADRDDATLLSPEVPSRFDRSQIQRVASGRERRSREDWRASREPMELTFLASGGSGERHERRAASRFDPSAGALGATAAARSGGALGAAALPVGVGERPREVGGTTPGGSSSSPGAGIRDGASGNDHRASADVATGRPLVAEGTPSVPANVQGKPEDTQDSEQEVELRASMQSIVHASTAGGLPGTGPGGQAGPGPTGSGGSSGPGSTARALGTGVGGYPDADPRDRRRTEYVRKARSKIGRFWKPFPKWAALEGLSGMTIVTFTIRSDGSVAGARVTRPSGVAEYDENCRQAVLSAAPFEPLPSEIGATYTWALPFVDANPAVRPKDVRSAR